MKKNHYELEIILLSTYCDIVLDILEEHKNLSVIKLITFSYLLKKKKFMKSNIYNASNKNDLVLKCLSQLTGLFDDYCENIKYIISAIHLLIENRKILEHSGEVMISEENHIVAEQKSFINLAIKESKNYSDIQFLKEVVRNV
ncbi:hypothetical protein SAMN04487943_12113 [Gracilibacillus orientalis]|uniref:Uncharacterized protein n=1 Tax=Gracilibacillus orientalis TaxID=334253 RepID=A0A1I4R636_9BACI|nr:hypothetical protein [Gracilibacillus orientalis]SFM47774.1 hypothetical protein SAMN04487943_12113 [Gracilibacillus orientalis]